MKYAVITVGCRVNQADSLGFEEELLARGAVAVQVGTALLLTPECGASSVYKEALRSRVYGGTTLTRAFSGRYARGLTNRFILDHDRTAPAAPGTHLQTPPPGLDERAPPPRHRVVDLLEQTEPFILRGLSAGGGEAIVRLLRGRRPGHVRERSPCTRSRDGASTLRGYPSTRVWLSVRLGRATRRYSPELRAVGGRAMPNCAASSRRSC